MKLKYFKGKKIVSGNELNSGKKEGENPSNLKKQSDGCFTDGSKRGTDDLWLAPWNPDVPTTVVFANRNKEEESTENEPVNKSPDSLRFQNVNLNPHSMNQFKDCHNDHLFYYNCHNVGKGAAQHTGEKGGKEKHEY